MQNSNEFIRAFVANFPLAEIRLLILTQRMPILDQMKNQTSFHRFIISMFIFMSMPFMQGCGCQDDCFATSPFSFNLIDAQTGKDIVFDLNVDVSELVLKNARNEPIDIYKDDRFLKTSVYDAATLKLIYQNKECVFGLTFVGTEHKCCDEYNITTITSNDAEVSLQNAIFTIKI